MKRAIVLLLALCATYAAATAPEWKDQRSESVREVWRFRNSRGQITIANSYRAYVAGADSDSVHNQADFILSASDSAYYLAAMRTGAPIRAGRFHIYKISPGADTLVYWYAYINGRTLGMYAVDDTSIAPSVVLTGHIKDYTIAAADLDTASVAVGGALDTTAIVTEVETSPVSLTKTLDVVGNATFDDWVSAEGGFSDPTATFSIAPDTSYSAAGWWFQHKVKVGSGGAGAHPDKLLVNGLMQVTGTSTTNGIANTGGITATTKIAATDSVSAYKSVIVGTPTVAGSLVLWAANGKKQTFTAPAGLAADMAVTIVAADTFRTNPARTSFGDRWGSIYVPGVLPGDIIIKSISGPMHPMGYTVGAGRVAWYVVTDSIGFGWPSTMDNFVDAYMVLRVD
jgi:hypothetical protein